jgi:hypothetical protein
MNVMSDEAKLENHQQVIFLNLADLREKAIPRKGVVMQKRNDGEKKEVIHRSGRQPESAAKAAPHVSMELPSLAEKKERAPKQNQRSSSKNETKKETRRTFGPGANNQNKDKEAGNNRRNNDSRRRDNANRSKESTKSETKNVTVRTFGRKKTQEENK